jgi:hypothetical protein
MICICACGATIPIFGDDPCFCQLGSVPVLEDLPLVSEEMAKAKFWSRVDIPRRNRHWRKACWRWTGALTTDNPKNKTGYGGGYGCLTIDGKWWRAHHYAWALVHGFDAFEAYRAEGLVWAHTCDNRKCVNPAHLEVKTYGGNLQDAYDRGRRNTQDEVPF